jgi:hypothetical protein
VYKPWATRAKVRKDREQEAMRVNTQPKSKIYSASRNLGLPDEMDRKSETSLDNKVTNLVR